jgi:hypothetical protein
MGPAETLSQAAFVDQIARQIKDRDGVLLSYYEQERDWLIRKIISNCFSALVNAQKRANNDTFSVDYFFRTTGFGGVAQALGDLIRVGNEKKDSSMEFFERVFKELFAELKAPHEGVGNAAMLRIKASILRALSSVNNL